MSSHCGQYFDIKKKKQYIGQWCLFKNTWEHDYTKIFVIDITDGLIKYRYSNSDTQTVEDVSEFDHVVFFPSPFKDDIVEPEKLDVPKVF